MERVVVEDPLSRGGHTHTHTLSRFAALWRKNLNRHLKSLRKERKTERAALKGQERKIGVAKSEYLALDWGGETSLKNHLKSLRESPKEQTTKNARKKVGGREGMYVTCVCPCVCVCVYDYLTL